MSSPRLFSKLSAVFSFPGGILGILDKGLNYQGSSASDDARACQLTRAIGSWRASEGHSLEGIHPRTEQTPPFVPQQDLTLLWRPPAPFLREQKAGCETGQGEGFLPRGPAGEGWVLMHSSAVTTGMGPAGARPCVTCGHLAGPRLLGEWSETKTQSGFLPAEAVSVVLGPLWAVTHAGQDRWGDPGRQGRQSSFHISFFLTPPPHPAPLVPGPVLGGAWGPPPQCLFLD